MFRYGCLLRPPAPGAVPRKGLVDSLGYSVRRKTSGFSREIWGVLIYDRELTDKEVSDYELLCEDKKVVRYIVERIKEDERKQLAKCETFGKAAEIIDLDKDMRGCDGSMYEVRRIEEYESDA